MVKNYFRDIFKIFSKSFTFSKENFTPSMLKIWGLIFLQTLSSIIMLTLSKEAGFIHLSTPLKVLYSACAVIFIPSFFFMFKEVFNLASKGLLENKPSGFKIIKSLLVLALFNCIPFIVFLICIKIASIVPGSAPVLKPLLSIFTYLFYISMSLSVCGIVFYQKDNIFMAVIKSVKLFFKKISRSFPVFLVIFLAGILLVYIICTIIYSILIYFHFLNENLANSIYATINLYSLYLIAGLYIGAQINIIKEENE